MRINDAVGMLSSVFFDWKGVISNPKYTRQASTISWNGYKPFRLTEPVTPDQVSTLASEGQYSFQISADGGIIQIYYVFDRSGRTVTEASLGYLGMAGIRDLVSDLEILESAEKNTSPPLETSSGVRWLRIDYHPKSARGILHGECHLHLGGLPDSRILVNRIPSPKQFVEFVIASCYPDLYQAHRLAHDGSFLNQEKIKRINEPIVECKANTMCTYMSHFSVPGAES